MFQYRHFQFTDFKRNEGIIDRALTVLHALCTSHAAHVVAFEKNFQLSQTVFEEI